MNLKIKLKGPLSILLIILFFSSGVFADSDWEDGYRDFLENSSNYKNHFKYNTDKIKLYIFDLDRDGVPEMILESMDNSYNIYTYDKRRVRRIYGEANPPNDNRFYLSMDESRLFRGYSEDKEEGYDEFVKNKNRLDLHELAFSGEKGRGKFKKHKYSDGEDRNISKEDYDNLTKGISVQSFNLEDIDLAIERYEEVKKDKIGIKLDGRHLPQDMPIINKAGSTYYPFRALLEGVGGRVEWEARKRQARGELEGREIIFPIDLNIYKLDGEERRLSEDKLTFLYKDRTYIPIRDFMESIGYRVDWDEENRTILLTR